MTGKNNLAFLTAVSLIILLLAILCMLLYGEFSGRKVYDGTFVVAEGNEAPWIFI